jgi:cephalosporin-C deacetylase-like acetyl esterase
MQLKRALEQRIAVLGESGGQAVAEAIGAEEKF